MIKKLFLGCLITLIFFQSVNAQWAECVPEPSVTDPEGVGVRYPYLLPVGFNNEYYHTVLTIISPVSAETWGNFSVTITRIQLTEITNIPEGLTWETNSGNADDYLYGGEKYCLVLEGTPNSTPGIRTVTVYANAWIKLLWGLFETAAPGNPQEGGTVKYTLCNELNLELGNDRTITTNVEFTLSADQNTSFHHYLWQDSTTNPTYTIRGSVLGVGTHKIKVTVSDTVGTTGVHDGEVTRCFKSDSINITVINSNAIDLSATGKISIFPNPGKDEIIITQIDELRNTTVSIFDIRGVKVLEVVLDKPEQRFDISSLSNGIYFVKFSSDRLNDVVKFLKE